MRNCFRFVFFKLSGKSVFEVLPGKYIDSTRSSFALIFPRNLKFLPIMIRAAGHWVWEGRRRMGKERKKLESIKKAMCKTAGQQISEFSHLSFDLLFITLQLTLNISNTQYLEVFVMSNKCRGPLANS